MSNYIADTIKNINKIDDNSYFKKLKQNPPKQKFLNSQVSFINAVDNWSKILGLMLAIVPSYKERTIILKNLQDEHGIGDNIGKSHVSTFTEFLNSLGNKKDIIVDEYPASYIFVEHFNFELDFAIRNKDWVYCAAMLGMIEYTYTTVSKNIHEYVCNFIKPEEIHHYSLHEAIDIEHAQDLFDLTIPYLETHKKLIDDGLQKGYTLMNNLYEGLSDSL